MAMQDKASLRVAVFGAGAVGGLIAGRLAEALASKQDSPQPFTLTLVARGAAAQTIAAEGLRINRTQRDSSIATTHSKLAVCDSAKTAALGPQDIVILGMKAHQIAAARDQLAPLIGPETIIIPAINGIPWWYFQRQQQHRDHILQSVDPAGLLAGFFDPTRIMGCVVYVATSIPEAGVITSGQTEKLLIGAIGPGLDDVAHQSVERLCQLLSAAGLESSLLRDEPASGTPGQAIRQAVWTKLWGNMWANPTSVLMEAGMGELASDPFIHQIASRMMAEAQMIGESLAIDFPISAAERLQQSMKLGKFKTSMLQDFEKGRLIELDCILGAVIEIGRLQEVAHPTLEIIYGLARFKAGRHGCYASTSGS